MLTLLLIATGVLTWWSGGYDEHKPLSWCAITCNFAASGFYKLHRTGQLHLKPGVLKVLDVLFCSFALAFLALFVWLMIVIWR
jgi:hypothetical protein